MHNGSVTPGRFARQWAQFATVARPQFGAFGKGSPSAPPASVPDEMPDAFCRSSAQPVEPARPRAAGWAGETLQALKKITQKPVPPARLENLSKLANPEMLSRWMVEALDRRGAVAAVIARQGYPDGRKHDPTGMIHAGIVIRQPDSGEYRIYNLIAHNESRPPRSEIMISPHFTFFFQQGGTGPNARLLYPAPSLQEKIRALILDGSAQRLLFTSSYNLVSAPASDTSLNCNKWVLLVLLAAVQDDPFAPRLLPWIQQHFQPARIRVHPLMRPLVIWMRPNVKGEEIPRWGPIHTVTVDSLRRLPLLESEDIYPALAAPPPEISTSGNCGSLKRDLQ